MIEPNHNKLTIVQQCKLLDISRSTYYYQPTGIIPIAIINTVCLSSLYT
ncbi:hypothetical protein [Rickettsia endosymbiont of Oedothorax gibbosus]|nr:hypothetical protein [Rickettsia endosymbiont of Oedothorax gibbosus]